HRDHPRPAHDLVDPYVTDDERTWAAFTHLAGFLGFMVGPLAFIGPLVLWLMKHEESPFVDDHGREALNFQISMWIYGLLAGILMFCLIGLVIAPVLLVVYVVSMIVAAVKANRGQYYRYPITIRFLS